MTGGSAFLSALIEEKRTVVPRFLEFGQDLDFVVHHECPCEYTFVYFDYGDIIVCLNQGHELLLGLFGQFGLLFSEAERMN